VFVGRLRPPARAALPALALTADAVMLTAWANDAGFDEVFARQVAAFGQRGDVLVAISTSGQSRNVVLALQEAQRRGLQTVALLGGDGGPARKHADTALVVPSDDTQHVQEAQLVILHLLADLVDRAHRQREGTGLDAPIANGDARDGAAPGPAAAADGTAPADPDAGLVLHAASNGHAWSAR
jgi:fructoselysine-6-P-deglycase FrlB-like protein